MIKIWSELPVERTREQFVDVVTLIWLAFWGNIVLQLFQFLIGFANVGRAVHSGGEKMIASGQDLGNSLAGLPVVGSQVRDLASGAFAAGGRPISNLGSGLEEFVTIVSVVLALLLAILTIGPWLLRYLPWRDEKGALVIFINRKDATAVIERADEAVREHSAFKRAGADGDGANRGRRVGPPNAGTVPGRRRRAGTGPAGRPAVGCGTRAR